MGIERMPIPEQKDLTGHGWRCCAFLVRSGL